MLKNIAELFYKTCLLTITKINNNNNKNLSQNLSARSRPVLKLL